MKIQIDATFNKETISGHAIQKDGETKLDAVKRSIERRIKKNIFSLNLDHRNSDNTAQYSGTVVKWNKYANAYDNLGTVTIWS